MLFKYIWFQVQEVPNFAFEFGLDDDEDLVPSGGGVMDYIITESTSNDYPKRRKSDIDPARRSVSPMTGAERTRSASVNFIPPNNSSNNNHNKENRHQGQNTPAAQGQRSSNLSLPVQQYSRKHSSVSNYSDSQVSSANLSPFFTPINQSPAINVAGLKEARQHFDFDASCNDLDDEQSALQDSLLFDDDR